MRHLINFKIRLGIVPCATFALAAIGALGCSEDAESKPDAGVPCVGTLEVAWGPKRSGSFVPFKNGDSGEITLGFQGFRYIDSTMRVSGVDATTAVFGFRIEVEGHAPYNQSADTVELSAGADGALYADDVLVFFNDLPIAEVIGRNTLVTAQAKAAGCSASTAATVKLVDEQACIELEDGGLQCQDGGAP